MKAIGRILLTVLYAIPPVFAALYAAATEIKDGQFYPWRPWMVDLSVYIRTAERLLDGKPFYSVPGDWLPFIYPPIAAIMSVPFTWMTEMHTQWWWSAANGLMIMAICYRLRFTGWQLSLVSVTAIWLIEPMRGTLGFGQVNIFLLALVALDLLPGPRVLGKFRLLPQGWMTGIATAIKLTPAIFTVYLLLVGRVKAAIVSFLSFCAATALGFIILPEPSKEFWGRLIGGDSGMNTSLKYFSNQSVIANYVRFAEWDSPKIPLPGLAMAAVVCGLGLLAAILWHRLGHVGFGISLTGFAALLGSPISWSHHFVWVLPLAIILILDRRLPDILRYVGLGLSLWVMYAPFTQFIDFQDEFKWTLGQRLLDAGTMFIAIPFFLLALALALVERRRRGLPWLPLTLREHERGTEPDPGKASTEHLADAATGSGGSTSVTPAPKF